MDRINSPLPKIVFPWNRFIRVLLKMTPEQRAKADPVKAAELYGLPVEQTTYWIEHYRRHQ